MGQKFKTLMLSKYLHKVFIIPNNLGLYFIGLWATCFLLSVGYASNLLLFMAILQLSLFSWWMITAHADLSQLKITQLAFHSTFAKTKASIQLMCNREDLLKENVREITLFDQQGKLYPLIIQHNFSCIFEKRGQYNFSKIMIGLNSGFWLFKTWKYYPIDITLIVYPEALQPPTAYHHLHHVIDESQTQKKEIIQATELDLQKEAEHSTNGSRINWKRFAQNAILVERYGENGSQPQEIFDLTLVRHEEQLSFITYDMLQFFQHGKSWFIKNNEDLHGPYNTSGHNKEDLHLCLSLLATYSL